MFFLYFCAMLYLHIPLCSSKCHYCDFYSVAARGVDTAAIVEAMNAEMRHRAGELNAPLPSIYFGGGTPSLLSIEQISGLLTTARDTFGIANHCEITLEANPEQLTALYLTELRASGVNRLSIGIQSFSDDRLSAIGRRHSAERAVEAVRSAQSAGFDNISIDLMFGFYDMEQGEWSEQLDRAFSLGVQHLSAYQLSIEPRTVFARRGVVTASDEQAAEQYEMLCAAARRAGFDHYEISNFALPDRRSRHNGGYWTGQPYLGIGAAAHSYDGRRTRRWNASSVRDYLAGTGAESEHLEDFDLHNEFVMTRLRTAGGLSIQQYAALFEREFGRHKGVQVVGDRAFIAERDLFIADSIIADLFLVD